MNVNLADRMKNRSPEPTAIEVRTLTCWYDSSPNGGHPALSLIDLKIDPGAFVVVSGPNGAGKTTLLNCMSGVIPKLIPAVVSGSVLVEGEEVTSLQMGELARKIGVVLEDPDTQIFGSTVDQYLAFGMELLAFSREEMTSRIHEAANIAGISELLDRRCHGLSGGEKQRMVVASMLVMRPRIMILDEPTSQLDPVGTREVFSALRRLNREYELTIILASHKLGELAPMATDLVALVGGEIRANGQFHKVLGDQLQDLLCLPHATDLFHACRNDGLTNATLPPTTIAEGVQFVRALLDGKEYS